MNSNGSQIRLDVRAPSMPGNFRVYYQNDFFGSDTSQMRYRLQHFYGQYYAVQAMWHAGGDYWTKWYPAIRDTLLKKQSGDGSFGDSEVCAEFGTAMACIILQMPNNYLPIFAP